MPFTLQWLNEDEDILVVKYTGRWTWEEVGEVDVLSRQLYAAANGRVDAICDLTSSAWVPARYVENVNKLNEVAYPNLHLSVFIAGRLMHDLIRTYNDQFQEFPYGIAFADNMAQAIDLIMRDRQRTSGSGR
jgi:hypothetical protein